MKLGDKVSKTMFAWKVKVDINGSKNFISILTSQTRLSTVANIFKRYFYRSPFRIGDVEFCGSVINYKQDKYKVDDVVFDTLNLKEIERAVIIKALERNGGSQLLAAKDLGISARMLNHKIHHIHKINKEELKELNCLIRRK